MFGSFWAQIHTNCFQSYQIAVLAAGELKHAEPKEGVGWWGVARKKAGVAEEVRRRSVFDTALIPQLSVKPFQRRNDTGF